jgi:hypothetical protein
VGLVYQGLQGMEVGGLWKRSISLYGNSARGTWRKGSFNGDPEGYVKEGYENGHLSP